MLAAKGVICSIKHNIATFNLNSGINELICQNVAVSNSVN
jgi:hypothetical protein